MERAVALLRRSVELLPDSGILLNSLGAVLGELGRQDEAMACFEKAMSVEPRYVPTYYNLAIGYYPHNRHREVISLLERRIAQDPNLADGELWLVRIRETLSQLENPSPQDVALDAAR